MSLIMTTEGWKQLGDGKVCTNSNFLQGVFRPQDQEDVQYETNGRAYEYADDVARYIAGNLPKEEIFRAFDGPIYGAFGEKL